MGLIKFKFVCLVAFAWIFECESLTNRTELALTEMLASILRNAPSDCCSDSLKVIIGALLEEHESQGVQNTKLTNLEAKISKLQSQPTQTPGVQGTKLTNLEAKISKLQSQQAQALRIQGEQNTKLTNLEAKISKLLSQPAQAHGVQDTRLTNLEAKISELQSQQAQALRVQETKLTNFEAKISKLQSQPAQAQGVKDTRLANLDEKISQLQSQLAQTQGVQDTKLTNLEAKISKLQSQPAQAQGVQGEQSNMLTSSTTRFSNLETPDTVTTTEGPLPADCWEQKVRHPTSTTGWYKIQPPQGLSRSSLSVYCDMDTAGGGWTVFQRRHNGSVHFNRKYQSYRQGFGNDVEFWMGNDALYAFTKNLPQQLRVDLCDYDTTTAHATYETFSVGPPSEYFRLNVGGYSGDAGDALDYRRGSWGRHNQQQFSALDVDKDRRARGNCAVEYQSGWWFDHCVAANLNGRHYSRPPAKPTHQGIQWRTWKEAHPLKAAEMKFRPRSANPKSTQPFVCT